MCIILKTGALLPHQVMGMDMRTRTRLRAMEVKAFRQKKLQVAEARRFS